MTHRAAMAYARGLHDPIFEGTLSLIGSSGSSTPITGKVSAERVHRRKTERGWDLVYLRDVESSSPLQIDDQLTIEGNIYSCESISARDETRTKATFRRIEIGELGRKYETR